MASKYINYFVLCVLAVVCLSAARLEAQATLLLEEPYSYDGTFAGTGHTAVYLSRVCAETPTILRRCHEGETGVVISRYHHIGGRDWIAVPLIPYLYAVENASEVPLFVDTKLVQFLRYGYLRNNMPDVPGELGPKSPLNQLAGSAYDRTLYAFRIATSPEQDDKLIGLLNSGPNSEEYALLNRNCADFVKDIINFYYPHATHRSVIGDLGVATPKQVAKSLVKYSHRHSDLEFSAFVIPQVPGSIHRSHGADGVAEALVKSKKYVVPLAALHPFVAGGAVVLYLGQGRFNPSREVQRYPMSPDIAAFWEMRQRSTVSWLGEGP